MPEQQNNSRTAVVIGAGISGLSAAYYLHLSCPDLQIRILEGDNRAGGVIKSVFQDDLLVECGPEAFSTLKGDVLDLSSRLSLSDRVIHTDIQNRRAFVCLEKTLRPLPQGILSFTPASLWSLVSTDIFSMAGKLRMSMDLFLPRRKEQIDESLSDFVTRRLGAEALRTLAEPMIGGIYGGDPELLSASATMPQLVEMERKHGSLIKGLMKSAKKRGASFQAAAGPRYGALASFDTGLYILVEKILRNLPEGSLLTGKTATHIMRGRGAAPWTVICADNSSFDADYLVLSIPAQKAASLLTEVNPSLSSLLQKIPRSPAVLINLVYERKQISRALDGFGFVVPRKEGLLISACSFSSVKFDGRSGKEKHLLRLFTGGMLKTQAMEMPDDELLQRCHQELAQILGIEGQPLKHFITRHAEAIPQYLVGHAQLLHEMSKELGKSPGIKLCGNSYSGVGLPDCIKTARAAAASICSHVAEQNTILADVVSLP